MTITHGLPECGFCPAISFSLPESKKFWFDPYSITSCWAQFDIPVIVESPNCINFADHTFEQFLGTQFVPHARRIGHSGKPNHHDLVTDPNYLPVHE
jgi:hypothetical protein